MFRRMILTACVWPLLLVAGVVHAQSARQIAEQVEMTMLVHGYVDIDREGRISGHELDKPDQLPDYVVELVADALMAMRFEPVMVGGDPVLARAKMTLRLVAEPDGDAMLLRIRSAYFGDDTLLPEEERLRAVELSPPSYPNSALRLDGKGTVYLLVKVGRDGSVEDVAVEQTNMTVLLPGKRMGYLRSVLERAAMAGAADWRFAPPVAGEHAGAPYWVVRVPVEFLGYNGPQKGYGEWQAYHPGVRAPSPEWDEDHSPGFSPDLLAAGTAHSAQTTFRLLNPPEP